MGVLNVKRDWGRVPKTPNADGHYRCSKCREYKPPSEFNKAKNQKSGLNYACRACMQVDVRKYNLPAKYGITAAQFAEKILAQLPAGFQLITISNRGTQVWPKGSVFTNLVNQYRCRIERMGDEACTQNDILNLYGVLLTEFKVCSIELLNMWGDKKGYSLAQGQ